MSGQPPLFEVATKTTRAPDFTDVLWFDVTIRVGGAPVLTCRYATADRQSTAPAGPSRELADSAGHAERQARATFGRRLAAALNPAPAQVP